MATSCGDDPVAPVTVPEQALAEIVLKTTGGAAGIVDTVTVGYWLSPTPFPRKSDAQSLPVFDVPPALVSVRFTSADEGSVFVVNAASNPDFAAAVAFLTNGVDDFTRLLIGFPPAGATGGSSTESVAFGGGILGNYNPDLKGASITGVSVVLKRVVLTTPGRDPNGDGNWTDHDIDVRLVITGRP